jgi:hypothetical protein
LNHEVSANQLQSHLTEALVETRFHHHTSVVSKKPARDIQHWNSVSARESGKWLVAIPFSSQTTFKSNTHFQTAVEFRLNRAIASVPKKLKCSCKTTKNHPNDIDKYGDHLFCCHVGNQTTIRHNMVVAAVQDMLTEAGEFTKLEERVGLRHENGKGLRPDIMIYNSSIAARQEIAIDVSCTHFNQAGGSNKIGKAAEKREKAKKMKFEEACNSQGMTFIPLIFETGGRFTENVHKLIKSMSKKIAEKISLPYSVVKHRWTTRLATVLQRANAMVLQQRLHFVINGKVQGKQGPALACMYREEMVVHAN